MIYLDSAATSLYKPPQVGAAMLHALKTCGSPGRGGHRAAMNAAELVYSCREEAARLFRVSSPEQVIFTSSATHGLNLAIRSAVKAGERVVISGYEHNAVLRPLYAMGAVVDPVQTPLFDSEATVREFQRKIPGSAAVVCTHMSNVFGYILPVEEIAELCRQHEVPLIVDAAQSAGILNIDFEALAAEFIAIPGHKGLMGPQGTGMLLCKNGGEPLFYGGTGNQSALPEMPKELPERLEAGTHNVCGIAGLREGLRYVQGRGCGSLRRKEDQLLHLLAEILSRENNLRIFAASDPSRHCGVLSVVPGDEDCEIWAEKLAECGVAVRAGLHCAPLAHRTAGTAESGTVRFSVSPFNTEKEICQLARLIQKI